MGVNVAEIKSAELEIEYAAYHQSAVTAVVLKGAVWEQSESVDTQVYGFNNQPNCIFTGYAITYSIQP